MNESQGHHGWIIYGPVWDPESGSIRLEKRYWTGTKEVSEDEWRRKAGISKRSPFWRDPFRRDS